MRLLSATLTTAAIVGLILLCSYTPRGTFGYGEPAQVTAPSNGPVTWLPEIGSFVSRGDRLFAIGDTPTVVMYGKAQLSRTLRAGLEGEDVRLLKTNLAEIDYFESTVDPMFTTDTVAAVKEWQEALGISATGEVTPAQIVFTPDRIRISKRWTSIGDSIAAGEPLLEYTGTARVVIVGVDPQQIFEGATAQVTMPDGVSFQGVVTQVSGRKATVLVDDPASLDTRFDGAPVRISWAKPGHL